jgi:3-hydroxymyristoyl/3-hydroxydecanoyl-(acyl carrier protein) dehydratase
LAEVLTLPDIVSQQQTGLGAELQLRVPATTPYFEGHYPNHPILPGVVQIGWAEQLARRYFALPECFIALEALKFQDLIFPGATLTLTLRYKPERAKLEFNYRSAQGQHSSGRLAYAETQGTQE